MYVHPLGRIWSVADGQEDARSVYPEQKLSIHVGNGSLSISAEWF